ncbi:MAG TPA: kelch repeat-containing protein [Micromonosporaceae bacterium]
MLVYHAYPVPDEPASTAGYAYNPTTSRWRKLAPIPAPPEVSEGSNSAVWTGTEMIVEGLVDAAYNPATNTWRPVNTAPYNSGGGSVTVWTGRQVLKWGGGCCGDYSASGSAYVPDTNRWYPLPASPLAGRRAAGTWTGTEMVIVGGEGAPDANIGGTKAFADAAAYNPVTHTWRRLPPLPAPRKDATATWTGTEVLVVGGQAGAPSYQMYTDGVAYNPATNRWRRIPAMPVGRVEHAAIWTGHQLLVWGGRTWRGDGWTTPLRGYAYNPARNRWTPMPTSPLRARVGHAAVWTGSRMLIWGGEPVVGVSPNAPAFVDGATYRP